MAGTVDGNSRHYYELIPNVSMGAFNFGSNIISYLDQKHTYIVGTPNEYERYYFLNPAIVICVDSNNGIESITCYDFLFFKDKNVIGMGIMAFRKLCNCNYLKKERFYVNREDQIRSMVVYDFDDIGLQVWTYRNQIKFISCFDLRQ